MHVVWVRCIVDLVANALKIHMGAFLLTKRHWQLIVILLGMAAGQFSLLTMRMPVSFRYDATTPQIRSILPNIGVLEYENDDPAQGIPLRWTSNTGELRLLGGTVQSDVLMSLRVHTGRPAGSVTTLQLRDQSQKIVFESKLQAGWRRIWVLLPAPAWNDGYQTLHYHIDGVALNDRRLLGLAVANVARVGLMTAPVIGQWLAVWCYMVLIGVAMIGICHRQGWHWGLALAGVLILLLLQLLWPLQWSVYMPTMWSVLRWGMVLCVMWWAAPLRRTYLSWWLSVLGVLGAITLLRFGYIASGALLFGVVWFAMPSVTPTQPADWVPRWWPWLLAGAVIGATLLRVIGLDALPQGMFRDEARHGGLAQQILSGDWMIYSPFANLPAGYFYLSAVPIWLFGPSAFAIRIMAALFGSVTIALAYWALHPWWGKSFALLTSLVMVAFLWHMGLSRIGFPTTIGPFLTLLAVGMIWRGLTRAGSWQSGVWGLGAGLATGAMTLGYHSARLMPIVVGLAIIAHWYTYRWRLVPQWRGLLGWCIGTALMAAPIIWYATTQSYNYMKRIDVTSLASSAVAAGVPLWVALQQNVIAYAGMFLLAGDENARHFFMGMPQLNIIEGLGFAVGCVALWYRRDIAALWLVAYLGIAIAPGILSVDAPHALRTVEATIPTAMIVAYGLSILLHAVLPRWRTTVVVTMLAIACAWSANTYWQWQMDPRSYNEFDGELTTAVRYVQHTQSLAETHHAQWYLPIEWHDSDVGVYLLQSKDIGRYDLVHKQQVPAIAKTMLYLFDANAAPPIGTKEIPLPASLSHHVGELRAWCGGECSHVIWLP